MSSIDISVSADVQAMFELPKCSDLKLPMPSAPKITLPTGAVIKAVADISKGIPTDCSANFSLMLQLSPLLASMECLLRILKLLGALVNVIKGLPFPPVKAIKDFIAAATEMAPCLTLPINIPPLVLMVHDILCLILKSLHCLVSGLGTVIRTMKGLSIQLQIAEKENNQELLLSLQCAQENAQISSQHLMQSVEPITALMGLVTPIMQLAGLPPIELPAIGGGTDVAALEKVVTTLEDVIKTLTDVVEGLGGPCS